MITAAVLLPGLDSSVKLMTNRDFRGWLPSSIELDASSPLREIISGQGPPGYETYQITGVPQFIARYPYRDSYTFEVRGGIFRNTYTGLTLEARAKIEVSPIFGPTGVAVVFGRVINNTFFPSGFGFNFNGSIWSMGSGASGIVTGTLTAPLVWLR
jgi:hypothetical protein